MYVDEAIHWHVRCLGDGCPVRPVRMNYAELAQKYADAENCDITRVHRLNESLVGHVVVADMCAEQLAGKPCTQYTGVDLHLWSGKRS